MRFFNCFALLCILFSCSKDPAKKITGQWRYAVGQTSVNKMSFIGIIQESLLIEEDSLTIMHYPHSIRTKTDYKYENDSIYFNFIDEVKYAVKVTDSTLNLSGSNYVYGNKISENYLYQKGTFDEDKVSMLLVDGYDKKELDNYNFCLMHPTNLEIHKNGETYWEVLDEDQTILPNSIGFRDSSNIVFENENIQMDNWTFNVVMFKPPICEFLFKFKDSTISCIYYSICTDWTY